MAGNEATPTEVASVGNAAPTSETPVDGGDVPTTEIPPDDTLVKDPNEAGFDSAGEEKAEEITPESPTAVLGDSTDNEVVVDSTLPPELPTELIEGPDLNSPLSADSSGDQSITGSEADKDDLPKALKEIAEVLDWNFQPTLPDTPVVPTAPPVTAEDLGLQAKSRSEAIPSLDYARYSQKVLPGLFFGKGLELFQVTNLWTQLSGVPSVVDIDSLAAADRGAK